MTPNLLKAQEESRVQGAIGFGFASHRLKNWCEILKAITKRSNGNRVITFDSHLKTALKRQIHRTCDQILCESSEKAQSHTHL